MLQNPEALSQTRNQKRQPSLISNRLVGRSSELARCVMPQSKTICSHCGARGACVTRGDYGLGDLGIPIVFKEIELVYCSACGNLDPVISDLEGVITALAEALSSSPAPLGDREAPFLRKFPVRVAG